LGKPRVDTPGYARPALPIAAEGFHPHGLTIRGHEPRPGRENPALTDGNLRGIFAKELGTCRDQDLNLIERPDRARHAGGRLSGQAGIHRVLQRRLAKSRQAETRTVLSHRLRISIPDARFTKVDDLLPWRWNGLRSHRTCVDAPLDASGILGTFEHVIRCGRVSGLEDAACHAPRAFMEICRSGPVRLPALKGAPSGMLVRPTRSLDRLPLRSLASLTSGDNPAVPAYAAIVVGSL
jgi:hypothetical protein